MLSNVYRSVICCYGTFRLDVRCHHGLPHPEAVVGYMPEKQGNTVVKRTLIL